ncbi:MAG: BON domain-containing protein [Acidobacteriia bacterium]|nr:BON domain-containing protein [Terriglobia bacterium]
MQRNRILLILVLIALAWIVADCSMLNSDKTIATDIKSKMFSDPDLKAANIDVAVKDGEVTLSGEVPNADVQLKAFKIASASPGVRKVNDQIKVAGAQVAQAEAPPESPSAAAAPAAAPPARKGSGATPAATPAAAKGSGGTPPAPMSTTPSTPAPTPEPQPVVYEIPTGTRMSIRMVDSVDSSKNQTGEVFRASTDAPISIKGQTVVPKNTTVFVKLANAKTAGHISGSSELELQLLKMELHGETYPLVSSSYQAKGEGRGKQTATRVGIGAAVGTAVGAIAGGGKGAAIGAAVGGGAGAGVQMATRGKQVMVPSETSLEFTLQAPVSVTVMPKKAAAK